MIGWLQSHHPNRIQIGIITLSTRTVSYWILTGNSMDNCHNRKLWMKIDIKGTCLAKSLQTIWDKYPCHVAEVTHIKRRSVMISRAHDKNSSKYEQSQWDRGPSLRATAHCRSKLNWWRSEPIHVQVHVVVAMSRSHRSTFSEQQFSVLKRKPLQRKNANWCAEMPNRLFIKKIIDCLTAKQFCKCAISIAYGQWLPVLLITITNCLPILPVWFFSRMISTFEPFKNWSLFELFRE